METNLFIDIAKTDYQPGGQVSGKILWALNKPPGEIILSLGWWTEGRGTKDAKIVEEKVWKTEQVAGEETFSFDIPESPYSFNGQLISLKWGLELSARKDRQKNLQEISVSPWGVSVDLQQIANESSGEPISFIRNR